MQRKRISWTDLEREFHADAMQTPDRQWCLEEAIDIVKAAASAGTENLPQLLEELYEKLKQLGEDAWEEGARRELDTEKEPS